MIHQLETELEAARQEIIRQQQRAEQERLEKLRLLEKLRELGVNPDDLT